MDHLHRQIIAAIELYESERRGPPRMLAIQPDVPEISLPWLQALIEALDDAKRTVKPRNPKGKASAKPASVNQRILEMLCEEPDRLAWPASKWADALECSAAAVKQTYAWKKAIRLGRA